MEHEDCPRRVEVELETIQYNQLSELGNRAVAEGLIIGHGHHQGRYEILLKGQALLMSLPEAMAYLQGILDGGSQRQG